MNNQSKLICNKLQITNDLNGDYCVIHDEFVHQSWGQKVDYLKLLNELCIIRDRLKNEVKECQSISTEDNDEEKQILTVLTNYQNMLNNRINSLYNMLYKLHDKANAVGGKYSFFAYRSDMQNLEKLERQTNIMGQRLQSDAVPFMRKYR